MATIRQETMILNLEEPFQCKRGGSLSHIEIAVEIHGELNADKSNAILVCHPLTMDAHMSGRENPWGHSANGWWGFMVGPNLPIDTQRFCVICCNVLGGCMGTTGPVSLNPATQEPYRTNFPEVSIEDMVAVQKMLMNQMGITKLYAVIGGSLGGMQALEWAVAWPDQVERCIAIATGSQLSSQGLAFDVVGRQCITSDPAWQDGQYAIDHGQPVTGLALARMIGHITYISKNMMDEKFGRRLQDGRSGEGFNTAFAIESFLEYNSEKFIQRFDPNAYLYLSKAMDTYDMSEGFDSLRASLSRAKAGFLIISFSSDWLFTPEDSIQLASTLVKESIPVTYANIETDLGHDAFLIDQPEIQPMKNLVQKFLHN